VKSAAGIFSVLFDERYQPRPVDAFVDALRLSRSVIHWAGPLSLVVPYDIAAMRPKEPWRGILVRLSSGSKRPTDLIADLDQAMRQPLEPDETLCRIKRPFSRSQSFFFSVSRLSCSACLWPRRSRPSLRAALVVQVERHQA